MGKLIRRLRALFRSAELDRELDEEMRFHLERQIELNIEGGMSPAEARHAALSSFGGVEQSRELCREARGTRLVEDLRQDLRYGLQMLRKNPAFTLVAVLSLGLGIGLNTTVFSFINSLMFRPLPLPEAERLVRIQDDNIPAYSDYLAFRDRADTFDGLAAYDFDNFNLLSGASSGRVGVVKVSGNYFEVLKVRMALGRPFSPEEDRPGGQPVAVLSYGLWQSRFGGDQKIVGKSFILQREAFTIIGVAPQEFRGVALGWRHDLWIPIATDARLHPENNLPGNPDSYQVRVIGRLKHGVELAQAQTVVKTIAATQDKITKVRLFTDSPDGQPPTPSALLPATLLEISPRDREQAWLGVFGVMAVMGSVLLVACANVANLLLGRAAKRRREIAIRLALGAGRRRIIRQLLTESLLLSLVGGALGLLLARWAADILLSILPRVAPREDATIFLDLSLDRRILLFTVLLSFVTGIAFGLVPALQTSKPDVMSALKDETPMPAGRGRRFTFRNALVVTQVAVSFLLLIPSGLLIRNMRLAQSSDYGFPTGQRYVMSVDLEGLGYDETRQRSYRSALLESIRAAPGIRSATLADIVPLSGVNMIIGLEVAGESAGASAQEDVFTDNSRSLYVLDQPGSLYLNSVETGYFETMEIPLARGRDFTERDDESSPDVIIVNETLARRLSPDGNALGKQLVERDPFNKKHRLMEVVGVVRDTKYLWPTERPRYFAYRPLRQATPGAVSLIVRSDGDRQALTNSIQRIAGSLDTNVPFNEVLTLGEIIDAHVGSSKVLIWLAGLLGFLATALASIGLYGVTAYAVSGRTKEIGIRMALGAKGSNVLRLILFEGLALILTGILIGLLLSIVGTRAMGSLLYGVSPTDPLTFIGVAALLTLVALVACYVPARRATKVDPLVALRYE
ncbi:MAG TPA: ABC transporter permease [Pyrinomonadaceae bacterium]|nr:ABC transporter permease [Pyrinomonadaceae bacterium]